MRFVYFFLLACMCVTLSTLPLSASTVAVGNCRPHVISYTTVSEAVAAVTPNSTVLVCPGNYPEQITIRQPLTLKGLTDSTGARATVLVPIGGIVTTFRASQILVEQTEPEDPFGPVNISNLVVDGAGSAFDCSSGEFVGISYVFASGTLDNVEVLNQNPGGCGFGMLLSGSPFGINTVNVRNSYIHNFDDTGIDADSGGETGFFVNLTSNLITSASTSVQAGVEYDFTDGLAARNVIAVTGKVGLYLFNFFSGMRANENTIIGADIGIYSGGSLPTSPTVITGNILFNNGTGIFVYMTSGNDVVDSNTIVQSKTAAIDVDCSPMTTARSNIIFAAPIGIANVGPGDTVKQNAIYDVLTATTACPN